MPVVWIDDLQSSNQLESLSLDERAVRVRAQVESLLNVHNAITIDLSSARSLSPSFAYLAFGLLYDSFKDSLPGRLQFVNDSSHLSTRVYDAIARRKRILTAEG